MKSIFVIGDSISVQYGPFLEAALQGAMLYGRKGGEEEALKNLDIPQGANGGDSSMVHAYLIAEQQRGGIDVDYILLNCGLHDLRTEPETRAKQVPIDLYRRNLEAIVELVSNMKPSLIWIRTTPCDEHVHNTRGLDFERYAEDCEQYNAAADEIMIDRNIPVIDLYSYTITLGPDLFCDHVHFKEDIQKLQGEFIAKWLIDHVDS